MARRKISASFGWIASLVRFAMLEAITAYRWGISPILGRHCRYHPSCSEYAEIAVTKHGPYLGANLALRRLCRCHPWHPGGYDPVP